MNPNSSPGPRSGSAQLGWLARRALGAVAALASLAAAPTVGHAQIQSGLARITLVAHAAPGVHLGAAGLAGRPLIAMNAADLMVITVNTAYRVELRTGGEPVVLMRESRAGLVPWDQIRARMPGDQTGPILLDLVVAPAL